jgi:hypothetical protein
MTATIELKPCPCGAQAHASEIIGGWMINCLAPQCAFEAVRDTRDEAVLAWNTRPVEDALRAQVLSLHADAGDAACKATQMASGNRAAAFVVEELHARISELEAALTAEKRGRHLADRLIHERDARQEEAGKRIAELEDLLSQLVNAVTVYRTGATNHAIGQAQGDMAEVADLAQAFLHTGSV